MKPPPAAGMAATEPGPATEDAAPGDERGGPEIDVVIAAADAWRTLPRAEAVVRRAIAAAAVTACDPEAAAGAAVAVLLCDDAAIADLNGRWRGIARATNVLSFPAPDPGARDADGSDDGDIDADDADAAAPLPLGDIAIAAETLRREAAAEGKTLEDHLAHLAVHGFLHLIGYDHDNDEDAEAMEQLERDILAGIGVADPYAAADVDI